MADKATDLVISYFVGSSDRDQESYEPLQKALDEGYRVVDVFTTPVTPGGACTAYGHTVVTVLLTAAGSGSEYWRREGTRQVTAG